MKRIIKWVDSKLIDMGLSTLLKWFQTRSPKTYATIVTIAGAAHIWATAQLATYTELCDGAVFCNETIETTITTVIYWISLAVAILSGAKFSEVKKK